MLGHVHGNDPSYHLIILVYIHVDVCAMVKVNIVYVVWLSIACQWRAKPPIAWWIISRLYPQ